MTQNGRTVFNSDDTLAIVAGFTLFPLDWHIISVESLSTIQLRRLRLYITHIIDSGSRTNKAKHIVWRRVETEGYMDGGKTLTIIL